MNTDLTASKQKAGEAVPFDKFSASLCISGDGLDLDEISRTLGLAPTRSERKGGHKVKWNDLWIYKVPVSSEKPLDEHIMALWDAVRPQIPYLRELKQKFQVAVLCQYVGCYFRGNFEVDQRSLGLFKELDVPFRLGVSIDIARLAAMATDDESPEPTMDPAQSYSKKLKIGVVSSLVILILALGEFLLGFLPLDPFDAAGWLMLPGGIIVFIAGLCGAYCGVR